jgi:hypothetical protein
MSKTIGEKRVRTDFNPGNNDTVQNLKEKFAHLINDVEELKSFKVPGPGPTTDGEKLRLISLAQTALEEACMWTVKAATA